VSTGFDNGLQVLGYLTVGTVVIALVFSWAIKHLGPPK
jgi:hypothetical protein